MTFQKYDAETHPEVKLVADWNDLVDYLLRTENYANTRGTATITAGNIYVEVTHNWSTTPDDVEVVPIDNLAGRSFWVSNIGATTFRINISSQDLQDHQFKWKVT